MINPINHYALTSAEPGVINEEAYTVLELVGECGRKINEVISDVNNVTEIAENVDERITAAQETANEALESANAAGAGVTENGERINNVSGVALEGRSVAFAAQAAANGAQETADKANATADKAYAGMEELEQIADEGPALNFIDQYGNLTTIGNTYVKNLLNKCMRKIKINLLQQVTKTYHYMFGVNGLMDSGIYNNGYVDIFINLTSPIAGRMSVGFSFKLLCSATPDSQSIQGQAATFSFESSGGIGYADFTTNGIGPNDFFITNAGFGNEIEVQF